MIFERFFFDMIFTLGTKCRNVMSKGAASRNVMSKGDAPYKSLWCRPHTNPYEGHHVTTQPLLTSRYGTFFSLPPLLSWSVSTSRGGVVVHYKSLWFFCFFPNPPTNPYLPMIWVPRLPTYLPSFLDQYPLPGVESSSPTNPYLWFFCFFPKPPTNPSLWFECL